MAAYQATNELPFPVLGDPGRQVYSLYGLGRGSVARVWGLRAAKRYVSILRKDGFGRLQKSDEDTLQLGGDFVIGPDGTLVYGFWGAGPDDRPSVDDLVTAVSAAMR